MNKFDIVSRLMNNLGRLNAFSIVAQMGSVSRATDTVQSNDRTPVWRQAKPSATTCGILNQSMLKNFANF
jgi:hypothetical protein